MLPAAVQLPGLESQYAMPKVKLSPGKHLQSVVEWRYERAHRYWDDCGKLVTVIENEFPGLRCNSLQEDGFKFAGDSGGINGASFYWNKATISQIGLGDARLAGAVGRFWPLVQKGLSIPEPAWIGHRTWICFEMSSPKDALRWLDKFSLWEFVHLDVAAFGRPRAVGSVLRTEVEPGGRRLRLETSAGTMALPNQKHHGVIVDADIVVEESDQLPSDFREFVDWNLRFLLATVEPLFRA